MPFTPGETVGPYRIIEEVGQGGMATVFKAYHPALDRYVAVKVLAPAFKNDRNFLSRFHREARIVARLDHPNIIPIYDYAEHEGTPYLVIRYVEGKTLKEVLRGGLLPPRQVLVIVRPVAEALAYAHTQGVLHRDIKPSNIIIGDDGRIYLTDFGLARMMQADVSTSSQDAIIGTPQYISPEQGKGEPVGTHSDIYSLGIVLFEMLTGRVPFSTNSPYAVIHDQIYTPPPLPSSINPDISPGLDWVLLKALAKDPSARFENATNLLGAVERAIEPEPDIIPPSVPQHFQGAFAKFFPIIILIAGVLTLGTIYALAEHYNAAVPVDSPTLIAASSTVGQSIAPPPQVAQTTSISVPTEQMQTPSSLPTSMPTDASIVFPTRIPIPATPTITLTPTPLAPPGMVFIPAGVFWMGASPNDGQADTNEKPGHLIDLSAFAIDEFEVSNAEYSKCVTEGVCMLPRGVYSPQSPQMAFGNPEFDDLPVVFVTQGMASQYCAWQGKRLPYEAEWEKAARGSTDQRIYPWGNTWDGEKANAAQTNAKLAPITAYSPIGCSPFGACNMSGNAAEWIADYYGANFYPDSIRNVFPPNLIHDPINWNSDSGKFVVRGGSFKSSPFDARVSKRGAESGDVATDDLGFRCAKSIKSDGKNGQP
jgi:serine/threonine protein kinase